MENLYYKPSGRITMFGILLYLLIGLVVASILGFVYVFAIWFIPFIYINFFLTLFFGGLLGLTLDYGIKIGKIRSPKIATLLAFTVGLMAVYLQWAIYETLLYNMGEVLQFGGRRRGFTFAKTSFDWDTFYQILTHPALLFNTMKELGVSGSWTLLGITVKGFFLWTIWVIEALMIIVIPMLLSYMRAEKPFSEYSDQWLKEQELKIKFPFIENADELKSNLEKANYNFLEQSVQVSPDTPQYATVSVFADDQDMDNIYLSLSNISKSLDKDGKEEKKEESIIIHLKIPFQLYQSLKIQNNKAV